LSDLIAELEEKRNKFNSKAEFYRAERDKLNAEAKRWAEKRDALNEEIRKLLREATEHRERRNAINKEVKLAKETRDKLNRKYNMVNDKLKDLKRQHLPKDGLSIGKLRKELKELEFKQMTSVLSPEEEREILDAITRIQAQIKLREQIIESNEEMKRVLEESRAAKSNVEAAHKQVNALAKEAQREHRRMIEIYERIEQLRKEVNDAQEGLIASKTAADEAHRKHIEQIKRVHDFDKIISGLKQKQRKAKKTRVQKQAKKQAEEIYKRLKRGEKLSTEDLLSLQRAGYT
jgi:uncharacterized coiled-coil DUF342 family protein